MFLWIIAIFCTFLMDDHHLGYIKNSWEKNGPRLFSCKCRQNWSLSYPKEKEKIGLFCCHTQIGFKFKPKY